MSAEGLARATAVLQGHVDRGDVAGVSAAVMRGGRVVYQVALGVRDVEAGDPLPEDALFRMYSMTRPVTSVAILMLHDEGRLHVDDPLVRWLPQFAEQEEVVDRVAALPLFEDPGIRYRYGMHAEILGRVIEVASGQTLESFLRERIFDPLGMRDAVFRVDGERAGRLATVHRKDAEGALRPHAMEPIEVTEGRTLVSAGVGLVASTEDILRFSRLLLEDGVVDGVRLLSPEAVRMARWTRHLSAAPAPGLPHGPGYHLPDATGCDRMRPGRTVERFTEGCQELIRANELGTCCFRPTILRG